MALNGALSAPQHVEHRAVMHHAAANCAVSGFSASICHALHRAHITLKSTLHVILRAFLLHT